jgi:tRNA nucleotidyltransferase/poly(A) polymerase
MSDYMFMLENHLSADQARVLEEVQVLAAKANVNLFLTGGAMRDMLGGFPIHDLDFAVEGPAIKMAKAAAEKTGAEILFIDETRKCVELRFPGGTTAEISMARQERYAKPGGRPAVTPATIHEDLRGRDFAVNAIALSLNRASRGLLLDPNNGLADLERKELRTVGNYAFYDDPIRLLRLHRFRVRLNFTIEERTRLQYENAREAQMETKIAPAALTQELRAIASETNAGDILQALAQEGLLKLYSPALEGAKLNLPDFAKLLKAHQLTPPGIVFHVDPLPLFLHILTEKLSAKETAAFLKTVSLTPAEISAWQKLEAKSKKLERDLKSAKLSKPSLLYQAVRKSEGNQVLFLLVYSQQRIVHDRLRNYLQKYLPTAQEITDKDVEAAGVKPGTPKFAKAKDEMVAARLDGRTKKPVPQSEVPPPGPVPAAARSRA